MRKLTLQEMIDLNNFIFPYSCDWDKRKKCDSFYIKENLDLKKELEKILNLLEENNIEKSKKIIKNRID